MKKLDALRHELLDGTQQPDELTLNQRREIETRIQDMMHKADSAVQEEINFFGADRWFAEFGFAEFTPTNWTPAQFQAEAHHQGFDPHLLRFPSSYPKSLRTQLQHQGMPIEGQKGPGAVTDGRKMTISVYPLNIPEGKESGVLAHEFMHLSLDSVIQQYATEQARGKNGPVYRRFLPLLGDGPKYLLVDYVDNFPAKYQSDYANVYLDKFAQGQDDVPPMVVIQEILAEMARTYQDTGEVRGSVLWAKLFREVREYAREIGLLHDRAPVSAETREPWQAAPADDWEDSGPMHLWANLPAPCRHVYSPADRARFESTFGVPFYRYWMGSHLGFDLDTFTGDVLPGADESSAERALWNRYGQDAVTLVRRLAGIAPPWHAEEPALAWFPVEPLDAFSLGVLALVLGECIRERASERSWQTLKPAPHPAEMNPRLRRIVLWFAEFSTRYLYL